MRVGFDARWYGGSGVGNYVAQLVQALATMPSRFELVVYENPANPLPELSAANVRRVVVHARRYWPNEQLELAYRCAEDRIDVFHAPFYVAPLLARCPVVVTIHDLIPFLFRIYGCAKQMAIKTGYRLAAFKASRVIADSQNTADDVVRLLGFPPERITVTPLAASPQWFHPHSGQQEHEELQRRYGVRQPYILVSSARNWRTKNLPTALRALVECSRQVGVEFQTVVSGPPDGLEEAMKEVGVSTLTIVRTGFVSTEDLAKLYRNARAFLIASRYEGFGLPLLEAMACGCAAVSSNAGSLVEVAGNGALTFHPDDASGMGQALARLFSDEAFWRERKAQSLRWSAEFSWEKTAARTVSVYSEAFRSSIGSTRNCRASGTQD